MLRSKFLPQVSVWDRLTLAAAWSDGQSGVIVAAVIIFIFLALVRFSYQFVMCLLMFRIVFGAQFIHSSVYI
jgi:hypothetical protein